MPAWKRCSGSGPNPRRLGQVSAAGSRPATGDCRLGRTRINLARGSPKDGAQQVDDAEMIK
jgi:hypothetical protein